MDTLEDLNYHELAIVRSEFTHSSHNSSQLMSYSTEKGDIAALMVQTFGQKSVEVIEDIITNIVRPGLFGQSRQRLKSKTIIKLCLLNKKLC